MGAGLILSLAYYSYIYGFASWSLVKHLPLVVLITFLMAGIGKMTARAFARVRMRRVVTHLIDRLDTLEKSEIRNGPKLDSSTQELLEVSQTCHQSLPRVG